MLTKLMKRCIREIVKLFLKFEPELDFFLPKDKQGRRFEYALNRRASVKDIIESLGIPHTEVRQIECEGRCVDFSFVPEKEATIHVQGFLKPVNILEPSFFSRCTSCNVPLEPVDKQEIFDILEPKTKKYYNTFFRCPECRKVFWRGTHFDNIKSKMSRLGILKFE